MNHLSSSNSMTQMERNYENLRNAFNYSFDTLNSNLQNNKNIYISMNQVAMEAFHYFDSFNNVYHAFMLRDISLNMVYLIEKTGLENDLIIDKLLWTNLATLFDNKTNLIEQNRDKTTESSQGYFVIKKFNEE